MSNENKFLIPLQVTFKEDYYIIYLLSGTTSGISIHHHGIKMNVFVDSNRSLTVSHKEKTQKMKLSVLLATVALGKFQFQQSYKQLIATDIKHII